MACGMPWLQQQEASRAPAEYVHALESQFSYLLWLQAVRLSYQKRTSGRAAF